MAKNIKNWSWEKIGVMLTTAALLITFWQSQMKIMGYLGEIKEKIMLHILLGIGVILFFTFFDR